MKVLESAENYLETIYILGQQSNGVHAIDIAGELGFSKPSVSIAMKRLRENGYITIDEFQHISLTPSGLAIARRVYERHDLLRGLLMRIGVSEEVASNDACRIEHVLSEESFACIRKYMEQKQDS